MVLAGDTRVDRTIEIVNEDFVSQEIEEWLDHQFCVIAGSSWPPEEKWIFSIYRNFPEWKWILAPHEVSEAHISEIQELLGDDIVTISTILSDEYHKTVQYVTVLQCYNNVLYYSS